MKCHWVVAAGFLMIRFVFRRFKLITWNKAESQKLLHHMHSISSYMETLQLKPQLDYQITGIKMQYLPLVCQSISVCFSQLQSCWLTRFLRAKVIAKQLRWLRQDLDKLQRDLIFEMVIYISDGQRARQNFCRKRTYPTHAVNISKALNEIRELLEIESEENTVAVTIHGPAGIGKTTLGDAVYASVNIHDFRFAKIRLFEDIKSKPNITKLQQAILNQMSGYENGPYKEPESCLEGQVRLLLECFKEHPCFLYIDNVLDSGQLEMLLPRLEGCKKLRILITASDFSVRDVLDIPNLQCLKSFQMPPEQNKEEEMTLFYDGLKENSTHLKYEELEIYMQMLLKLMFV